MARLSESPTSFFTQLKVGDFVALRQLDGAEQALAQIGQSIAVDAEVALLAPLDQVERRGDDGEGKAEGVQTFADLLGPPGKQVCPRPFGEEFKIHRARGELPQNPLDQRRRLRLPVLYGSGGGQRELGSEDCRQPAREPEFVPA